MAVSSVRKGKVPESKAEAEGTEVPGGGMGCWAKDGTTWTNVLQRKKKIVALQQNFKRSLLLNTAIFLQIYWFGGRFGRGLDTLLRNRH